MDGPPGIGVSRLLTEVIRLAGRKGARAYLGHGDEVLRSFPLAPLLSALHLPIVSRKPAGSVDASPGDGHLGTIEVIRERLEEVAKRTPVVVVVDDVRWADPTTLLALRLLPRSLAKYPVTWVLGRAAQASAEWVHPASADRPVTVRRLQLGPLPSKSVDALVMDLLSAAPGPEIREITACAEGHPAALTELVGGLALDPALRIVGGTAHLSNDEAEPARALALRPRPELPAPFLSFVRRRLDLCVPTTRRLVELGAVLGCSFLPDDAAELAGLTVSELLPAVQDMLAHGWADEAGEAICFRSEMLRQGVLQGIPGPSRAVLHREAAGLLLRGGATDLEVAPHLAHGARRGDDESTGIVCRAAELALTTSPRVAGELASRALELMADDDPARSATAATVVEALVRVGPLDRALDSAKCAVGAFGDRSGAVRQSVAIARMLGGDSTGALAVLEELQAAGVGDPVAVRALRAMVCRGDVPDDDAAPAVRARHERAHGRVQRAVELARQAVDASPGRGPANAWFDPPQVLLATLLADVGHLDEAAEVLAAVSRDVASSGMRVLVTDMVLLRARIELASGRPDQAVVSATDGLALADQSGAIRQVPVAHRVLAAIALQRGDLAEATLRLGHLEKVAGSDLRGPDLATAVWIAEAGAEHAKAGKAISELAADPRSLVEVVAEDPAAAGRLVALARRVGRDDEALSISDAAAAVASANDGVASFAAAARHARGTLDRDADQLRHARDLHRDEWSAACASEELAAVLVDASPADAVEEFDRALSGYVARGATYHAARVRRSLRDLGHRRRHWRHAKRPETGWASLTETELQVSQLVATGLTNRQVASQMFLSPHTVGFHLRQIYRKLEIRSRVELAQHQAATP